MEIQWALVLFTVISGAGAWLFAFSMLGNLLKKDELPSKLETIVSFVLLVVGGCASVFHLSHVDRILEALNHPTSGIFIEAALIGVCCVILAIYFIMLLRGTSKSAMTVVGVIGMIMCVIFSYECGASYMMDARPAWNTIATPLAYFGTACAAGAGLNMLLKGAQKRPAEAVSIAGMFGIVGGALGLVLAGAFFLVAGTSLTESTNGAIMWAAVTIVTAIVLIACGAMLRAKPESVLALGAVALVVGVVAAMAMRVAMWLIGTPFMDFFLMALE